LQRTFKFLLYNGENLLADTRLRAVRKRTPRIPVGHFQKTDNRKLNSPTTTMIQEDDEEATMAAMALADVSQRGGSFQISYLPSSDVGIVKVFVKMRVCIS
jgi:hypothetical protein